MLFSLLTFIFSISQARRPLPSVATNANVVADRTYYIGCVEKLWDYAPSGRDLFRNIEVTKDSAAGVWLHASKNPPRIGRKYWKSLYSEFEDGTFTKEKKRCSNMRHLGALGPIIRGVEGETLKVVYKNMCSFPNSMHPHGVLYDKTSEGAPYFDGSTEGDSILPGQTHIYIWKVRRNAINEYQSSKLWLYHSHVDEIVDVHSGLVGPIVVYRNEDNIKQQLHTCFISEADFDREFVNYFVLYDENKSHLFEKNLAMLNLTKNDPILNDEDFQESNLMHSINGYLFSNLPELNMNLNENVRWYVASLGNEKDGPHTPHWHGNLIYDNEEVDDTVIVLPGTTKTVDMLVDASGKWFYHCHVHDHIDAGMVAFYKVCGLPNCPKHY